ncbi:MAG: polyamine ABC transporter substrate-binding protein [Pseudomonadota bacterium]
MDIRRWLVAFPSAVLCSVLLAASAQAAQPVLTVVNWEEWLSPDVVKSFENKNDVKVNVLTYTSTEESLALLAANKGKVDILVGSTVQVEQLKSQKMLRRLDRNALPNVKHILPRFNADPDYAVPYLWGYSGIIYRTDLVKTPIRTYADLFALARQQPGKVSLLTDQLEYAYGVLWGMGTANPNPENTAQVGSALNAFAAAYDGKIRLFDVDYEAGNPIASGQIIAAQGYSDYATFLASEQQVPVAFVNPEDVCIVWQDNLMIPADAPQPELAQKFMNYLTEARVAARNAMAVKSTSANPLAMQYYSDAYRNNPVIRPSFEGTERCRVHKAHSPAVQKFYDRIKLIGTK